MYLDQKIEKYITETGFTLDESDSNKAKFIKTYINMLKIERFGTIIANNKQITKFNIN